jgi:hypothetical protein
MEHKRIVAVNKDEKCQGYTIEHRPCRLKREIGKMTCKVHKCYFKNWTRCHPYIENLHINKIITKRYEHELVSGFKYINIKKYIEEIPRDTKYASYYLLLCRYSPVFADINPLWNMYHFHYAIGFSLEEIFSEYALQTNIMQNTTSVNNKVLKLYRVFDTILVDNMSIGYGYKFCITELIRLIWVHSRVFIDRTIETDIHLCEVVFQWNGWYELLYTKLNLGFYNRKLIPNYLSQDILNYMFYNIINPALKNIQNLFIAQQRSRCNIYKEELMQVVWHPDKVEKLMNMGIDPDDM